MRAWIVVAIGVSPLDGRVKKEKKNREWFMMEVSKWWKGINIILFLSGFFM
jgi:hypothetical protein